MILKHLQDLNEVNIFSGDFACIYLNIQGNLSGLIVRTGLSAVSNGTLVESVRQSLFLQAATHVVELLCLIAHQPDHVLVAIARQIDANGTEPQVSFVMINA